MEGNWSPCPASREEQAALPDFPLGSPALESCPSAGKMGPGNRKVLSHPSLSREFPGGSQWRDVSRGCQPCQQQEHGPPWHRDLGLAGLIDSCQPHVWSTQVNKLSGSGHLSPSIWCLQHPAGWLQGAHCIQEKAPLHFVSQPWILPASQETPV